VSVLTGNDLPALLDELGDRPLRAALAVHASLEAAQDAVQQACLRYLGYTKRGGCPDNPSAFFLACVVNEARRGWSRTAKDSRLADVLTRFVQSEIPDTAQRSAITVDLWLQIQALPAQQRAALGMKYYLGLTNNEIAAALECRPATVRSLIHRAIAALRRVRP